MKDEKTEEYNYLFGRKTLDLSKGCKPASNLIWVLSYGTKQGIVLLAVKRSKY